MFGRNTRATMRRRIKKYLKELKKSSKERLPERMDVAALSSVIDCTSMFADIVGLLPISDILVIISNLDLK